MVEPVAFPPPADAVGKTPEVGGKTPEVGGKPPAAFVGRDMAVPVLAH